MNSKGVLVLFFAAIFSSYSAMSQKPAKSTAQQQKKIKPPKLFTTIGVLKDSALAPVEQVKALIASPLKVTDIRNQPLTITYYQLLYIRKAMTEDEETGKISPTKTQVSDFFTQTPLPLKWIKLFREELLPGEELYFFDIIVKDKAGNLFYAPNMRLMTK